VLSIGLSSVDLHDAATILASSGIRRTRLMLATWFALHVEIPIKVIDIPSNPSLRLMFALHRLFELSDEVFARPNVDWEAVMEQLSSWIGGLPLLQVAASHKENMEALASIVNEGKQFSGLAHEHLSYLLNVAQDGFAVRAQPLVWLDEVGWPKQEDPYAVTVNWRVVPLNIGAALSHIKRVNNMIQRGAPAPDLISAAKSLF
jgi:hypothetical protein